MGGGAVSRHPRWHVVVGAVGGLVVGIALARVGAVWRSIAAADWSILPATVVGTLVPAAAGLMFAQRVARQSARDVKRAELETQEEYDDIRRTQDLAEARDRRVGWDLLYQACVGLREHIVDSTSTDQAIRAHIAELTSAPTHETASEARANQGRLQERARTIVLLSDCENRLRAGLRPVQDALHRLVHSHGVEALHVAEEAFALVHRLLAQPQRWCVLTAPEEIAKCAASSEWQEDETMTSLARAVNAAVEDLARLASRQRVAPVETEQIDTQLEEGTMWWRFKADAPPPPPRYYDALGTFARLHDAAAVALRSGEAATVDEAIAGDAKPEPNPPLIEIEDDLSAGIEPEEGGDAPAEWSADAHEG